MPALIRSFLVGLSILLPVILSFQLVVWLTVKVEKWSMSVWAWFIPEPLYFPGLALFGFLLFTTLIGFSVRLNLLRSVIKIPGRLFERIPLVSYVYSTIKDLLELMAGKTFTDQSVVWVTIPEANGKLLGIVTKHGDDKNSSLASIMKDEEVAVYLPMSYQAGGYMLVVPKDRVEHTDMKPGEAMHLIMSAGLGSKKSS